MRGPTHTSQVNPFRYRMCQIFCSNETGFMDFDDFLDLVAIMSDRVSLYYAAPLNIGNMIYLHSDIRHEFVQSCHGPSRYLVCWLRLLVLIIRVLITSFFHSDFNDDDAICAKDLNVMLDMLTGGKICQAVKDKIVDHVSHRFDHISWCVLTELH